MCCFGNDIILQPYELPQLRILLKQIQQIRVSQSLPFIRLFTQMVTHLEPVGKADIADEVLRPVAGVDKVL